MKKITMLVMMVMMVFSLSAQWETGYFVDDFGDQTDKSYEKMIVKGSFSNSATSNSSCSYIIVKQDSSLYIKVREYEKYKASFNGDVYVYLKTPNDSVTIFYNVKTNGDKILFEDDEYNAPCCTHSFSKLMSLISEPGKYKMSIAGSSKSKYRLSFTIEDDIEDDIIIDMSVDTTNIGYYNPSTKKVEFAKK